MPDKVARRRRHSIDVVVVRDNCIWVMVTGGSIDLRSYEGITCTLLELSEEHKVTITVIRLFCPENFHVIIYYTRKFREFPLDENCLQ